MANDWSGVNNPKYKHGKTGHKLHNVFNGMKQRCYDPNHVRYGKYGGKGITICDEWLRDFMSFYDWCMENGWKEGLTVDRIDHDLGYSPDNCRIVSYAVQSNNLSNNRMVTWRGRTQTITQWSRETGLRFNTIKNRIKNGWDMDDVMTKPARKINYQHESKHMIEWNGKTQSLTEWSKELDIHYDILYTRVIRDGWDLDRAFSLDEYKKEMSEYYGTD